MLEGKYQAEIETLTMYLLRTGYYLLRAFHLRDLSASASVTRSDHDRAFLRHWLYPGVASRLEMTHAGEMNTKVVVEVGWGWCRARA